MINAIREFARDIQDARRAFFRDRSALLVAILFFLPWFGVIITGRNTNVWEPFLQILGLMFVYWFFTRRQVFTCLPIRRPPIESALAIIFVLLWMLFRIGQYTDLLHLPQASLGFIENVSETIAPKLLEMVLAPFAVYIALRYRPAELGLRISWRDWIPALVPIAALLILGFSRHSPEQLGERTVYYFLGAGLPEEFLFRAILQSRLEALTTSPAWGLYLASFLFGFSHLPINLSNASPENWFSAFESAFTFQFSIGLALGFAFQRARNVIPLTVIHALIDAAP